MKLAVMSEHSWTPLSWDAFARRQSQRVSAAAGGGADLVILPDGLAAKLKPCGSPDARPGSRAHLHALQPVRSAWIALHRRLASTHAMAIVAGSFPVADGAGRHWLRTDLFLADGSHHWQDRLHLTLQQADSGWYAPGRCLNVMQLGQTWVAIAAGHDAAYPLPVRAQCQAGATLLLMPCIAENAAEAAALRIAAQARALENHCIVAQSLRLADSGGGSYGAGQAAVIDPANPSSWQPTGSGSSAGAHRWQIVEISAAAGTGHGDDAVALHQRNWACHYFPSVRQPRRFGRAQSPRAA